MTVNRYVFISSERLNDINTNTKHSAQKQLMLSQLTLILFV